MAPSPVEMHLQVCVLEEWTSFCVNLNLQSSWQQPQSIQKQLSALITASSSPLSRQISVSHTPAHLPCSNYSLTSLNSSISVHIQMHRPQIASILLLHDHAQKRESGILACHSEALNSRINVILFNTTESAIHTFSHTCFFFTLNKES